MNRIHHIEYYQAPSALRYMSLAFLPKKGFKNIGNLPAIIASLKNHKPNSTSVKTFDRLTNIQSEKEFHPIFLHTISFRMIMSVLTHPAFPEPIWSILQIRNIITQHQAVSLGGPFDLIVKIADHRILEKGLEMDLHTSVVVSNKIAWESSNTFYIRGNFGLPNTTSTTDTPIIPTLSHSTWNFPSGGGKEFGSLTGDYNGIHMWDWYAKIFKFKSAFSHPQRILGQIFNRLVTKEMAGNPIKIETWLKGPVYYGSNLELRTLEEKNDTIFSLHVNDDQRPAIIGRYSNKIT